MVSSTETWYDMKDCQVGAFELVGVTFRVARRGGDEFHALIDHKLDDVGVAHKGLRDIDPEWFVGEFSHLLDFFANGVEFSRRRFNDAEPTRVRDSRRQL